MTASPQAQAAMDRFIQFYAELVKAKQMIHALADTDEHALPSGINETEASPSDYPADPPPRDSSGETVPAHSAPQENAIPTSEAASDKKLSIPGAVMEIFLRLRIAICPTGTPPPALDGYPDIGYVMAATADEAMLHQCDWPEAHIWLHTLLEESLYGSRISGERLFELGERIVAGEITGRDDMAVTILLALSLNFRGRWRGINDHGVIQTLRAKLYENVYGEPVPDHIAWHSNLANSLTPVLDKGKLIQLPRIWPWVGAIAAVLIAYTCLSSLIWAYDAAGVTKIAHQVLASGSIISREEKT